VSGGVQNTANGSDAVVGGGEFNTAGGQDATISGGGFNTTSANWATVAGGYDNTASGTYSFAAGRLAQALHSGSFVWADDTGTAFSSTTAGQFSVRARGGIVFAGDIAMSGGNVNYHNFSLSGGNSTGYLYGSYPAFADGVQLGYNYYADSLGNSHIPDSGGGTSRIDAGFADISLFVGGVNTAPTTIRLDATTTGVTVYGTFNNSSDRNAKQDFVPVSSSQILDKVLQLPVTEWSYKTDATTRHIGPMGQDFYSTFNIGTDEKHIAPIDEGGVALAAIQGLNHKLNDKLDEKDAEIQALQQRLEKLEQLVGRKNGGQ
jgi:trimeric autotransporter adhesin